MEATHDTHTSGGGFWSIANVLLGLAFGAFALIASTSLINKGLFHGNDKPVDVSMPAAAATPSQAPAASSAPIPATATATAPASGTSTAVTSVTIHPLAANPMAYDTNGFTVKSGTKVSVTFTNDSKVPLQHNLIICKPGTKDKVLSESMAMLADPKGLEKGYVPDSQDILWHTKLLNPNSSETLEFTAPAPGEYPYFCSFPGHAVLMNGIMKVE